MLLTQFMLFVMLYVCFWLCCGSLFLFSSCEQGLLSSCGAQASQCSSFYCVEHGLWGVRASVVVAHELRHSAACGIFPDIKPMSLAVAGGFLSTGPSVKSWHCFFLKSEHPNSFHQFLLSYSIFFSLPLAKKT